MRIGIDARFFGPDGKGLGRYTERLILNLEKLESEHEFVVFLRKENFDQYRPGSDRFRKVLADFSWYGFAEQFRFPSLIRREKIDLMHFPHFNVPLATPCPYVVTIHDLILFRFPTRRASKLSPLFYAIKYLAYRIVIRRAVSRANRIIAVSECTKQDLLRAFRIPSEKIAVTYEAADLPPEALAKGGAPLTEHGITKPYFLYVGNAYPHKNLESLLAAFKAVRRDGLDAQLVLVGRSDYFYERLKREADRLGLTESADVVFYGFAEDRDLPGLYRQARAYVFPSFIEGFGLPALEAMRHGTPVAASDSSCLPEILADAAAYFRPDDIASMAGTLKKVFEDETLRGSLSEKGYARVAKFSWQECALKTYGVYRDAIRSHD
jgi:glycosyltransferase involved in cell wall biosynthesis